MKSLKEKLEGLGLSDYEASVYGVLIEASPASATTIAKKCGLSRSSVYTTLSALIARGLVGTSYKNEVKQFVAQGYDSLLAMVSAERRRADGRLLLVESLKHDLERAEANSLHVPDIVTFEGEEGLKKIYLSMLREAKNGAVLHLLRDEFIWKQEWDFVFEDEWRSSVRRLKKEKGITTKLLVNDSDTERMHMKPYTADHFLECRWLSDTNSVSDFGMYIIGDVVSILSFELNNLVGIRISNKNLAHNYRKIFDGLWVVSKQR